MEFAQLDQSCGSQRMVELPSDRHGFLQLRHRLRRFALARIGQTRQHVGPGLRPVVQRCPPTERLGQRHRQRILAAGYAQDLPPPPLRQGRAADDLVHVDLRELRQRNDTPAADYVLVIEATLQYGIRVRETTNRRAASRWFPR